MSRKKTKTIKRKKHVIKEKLISEETDPKRRAKDLRLQRTYGITLSDWDRMYKLQEGKCYICNVAPKTYLCTDHRHVLGYKKLDAKAKRKEVRALLCFRCNVMLGKLEKNKESRKFLQSINRYFSIYRMKGDAEDFRPYSLGSRSIK